MIMTRETDTMKKTICFLLIAALALSLTGCSAGALTPAATEPPASAAPGTAAPAGTPEETAAPKETGEPEGRLVVSFSTEAEDFTADDGEQQLLNFSCTAPTVTISGRESAAETINAYPLKPSSHIRSSGPRWRAAGG